MPHYALIDAARDPRILPMLKQEARWRCMFAADVRPEIAPKAPYIVRLDPGSPFTNTFRQYGWINAWGVTCHAPADLHATRKALRPNLEAMMPGSGKTVLFRFYDPRVFVPFIEACTPGDLGPWFDPVDAWWAPHPRSGATMKYTLGPEGLVVETV